MLKHIKKLSLKEAIRVKISSFFQAYSMLEDETIRKKCLEVVEEAKGRTVQDMEERRKALKRQGKSYRLEEDDPAKFHESVRALTTKLFADLGCNQ